MKQIEIVRQKLLQEGQVDNFWAIDNRILRLGAVIHKLKSQGMDINGFSGKEMGLSRENWKNYYYFFKSKVEKEQQTEKLFV